MSIPTVDAIADDSGYHRVLVDGVQVSQHAQQHKAIARGANEKLTNPSAKVTCIRDLIIEFRLSGSYNPPVITPDPEPDPEPEPDPTPDPDPVPDPDPDPVDPTALTNVDTLIDAGWNIPDPDEWWIEHPTAAEIKSALIAPFQSDANSVCVKRLWMPHVMATGNYDPSMINAIKNTATAMHRRAIVSWWERDINGNTAASDTAMQQAKDLFNTECDTKIATGKANNRFKYPLYSGDRAKDEITACLTLDWILWDSPAEFEAAFAKVKTLIDMQTDSEANNSRNFCAFPGKPGYDGYNNSTHASVSSFYVESLMALSVYGVNPSGASHTWASDAIDRMLLHPSNEQAIYSPFEFANYLSLLSVSGGGLGGGREWGADQNGPGAGGYEGAFIAGCYYQLCPVDTATNNAFSLVEKNLYFNNRWRGIVAEEDKSVRRTYMSPTVSAFFEIASRKLPSDSEAAKRYSWCADRNKNGYNARALQALCPPPAVAEGASGEFADRVGSRWCYRADLSQPDSTFRVDIGYRGYDCWRESGDDAVRGFAIGSIGLVIGHANRCAPSAILANGVGVYEKLPTGLPFFAKDGYWLRNNALDPYHSPSTGPTGLYETMPARLASEADLIMGSQTMPTKNGSVWSWTRDWSDVINVFPSYLRYTKQDERVTGAVSSFEFDSAAKRLIVEDTITADMSAADQEGVMLYLGWHFSPSHTPVLIDANTFEFTDGTNTIRVTLEPLGDFELIRTVREGANAFAMDGYTLPLEWHDSVAPDLKRIAANVGYVPDRVVSDNIYNVRTTIEVVQ